MCCDAREFNGAGDGCISHDGKRADLVGDAVSARVDLDDVDKLSLAELLKPTEVQPCLREIRYVAEGPNPAVPCDTVPTRWPTPCPLRRYCARADKADDIIPRRPSFKTINADEEGDEILDTFFCGKNEGINPTCSSPSEGVSEFMNRLITVDLIFPELVTISNVRPPGRAGVEVPPSPAMGRRMASLIPPGMA